MLLNTSAVAHQDRWAVVWINLPGVWGDNLAVLYLAQFVNISFGLIAAYVMLVV